MTKSSETPFALTGSVYPAAVPSIRVRVTSVELELDGAGGPGRSDEEVAERDRERSGQPHVAAEGGLIQNAPASPAAIAMSTQGEKRSAIRRAPASRPAPAAIGIA